MIASLLGGCGRVNFDPLADAADDPRIAELSFHGSAPCVRSGDGRVACWGENEFGQVGRGNISLSEEPGLVPIDRITSLATGENIAFAIDRDGALWGWGDNRLGQLGIGTTDTTEASPRRVDLPNVVQVATGEFHSCAITDVGDVYCWGENSCGQLGTGDVSTRTTPTLVAGVSGARQITVTDRQTCIVDDAGAVECMGGAYYDPNCVPVRLVPTPVVLPPIKEITGGCHLDLCAVDTSGDAWCWGENQFGGLGDGTQTSRADPAPVLSLTDAMQIGAGFDASCAATTNNEVYCWGRNPAGQLGVGSTITRSNTPLRVPFFTGVLAIDQLEVGCNATCVRSGTDIYCWGYNAEGIVDSTSQSVFTPVQRGGLPF